MGYERLKQRMKDKSLSANDVAKAVGVSEEEVEGWIEGTEELKAGDALAIKSTCFPKDQMTELFAKSA